MNRIYQGRVNEIQRIQAEGDPQKLGFGERETCPLWHHHQIFQDAVNYYLVAFGALADPSSDNRVIRDLHSRLEESWARFPGDKHRASSLRDSIRRTLPQLASDASLQDAYKLILAGNEASGTARMVALALLLAKCGGEAAIQQGGRGYLPRFCDAKSNPTWDYSVEALEAGSGLKRLAAVLHGDVAQAELQAIANEMCLSWTVKLQPGKFYDGDDAKARLREALTHLLKLLDSPSQRLTEAMVCISSDPAEFLRECLSAVDGLPNDLSIPRNRKAAQDLTFSSIAFKHFPNPVTKAFLKLGVKAPGKDSKSASTAEGDTLLASLGDDPIKLARGARGYVFPAFTALPAWNPRSPGEPAWKEFDIAAFKESLKSLNQFNQKTIEREGKLQCALQTFAYVMGTCDDLPKSDEGDEEAKAPPRPGKDSRWPLIECLEKELGENLSEGDWRISRGALRGLRDIAELWNKKPIDASVDDLKQIVREYQADDKRKREIGSVQLFLLLCEERYRSLWRSCTSGDGEAVAPPVDILFDTIQVHRLKDEVNRFRAPIRLTPAEPRFSRRLFMFSDLTDKVAKVRFGKESKEGGLEETRHFFETAIAMQDRDGFRETRVRIGFTAPRLHRDELLGGEESRWLQPMASALGLGGSMQTRKFDSAVALMPDSLDDATVRHLLNFPVSLDPSGIHEALGKESAWKHQFNGTKEKNLHLHWPGTATEATKRNPWWENPKFIEKGFTVLSNDLGQRSAGAWALLRVTCRKPDTKRPVRSIGSDGMREWFAEAVATGMHRLPGEEAKVLVAGEWKTERYGQRGRPATNEEYSESLDLAKALGAQSPETWMGAPGERTYPELNDQLIRLANRRLTRLLTYHRWSCFSPENLEGEGRRERAIENMQEELGAYQDPDVCGLRNQLESEQIDAFRLTAGEMYLSLRNRLEVLLVGVASRVAPLRGREWHWVARPSGPYGDLIALRSETLPKIRGQRGLSMLRLEQLEGLRRLFLRYNRSGDRSPGEAAKFGRADRGRESGEPCQELLDKIDKMKVQRVNLTAHLILAQALGVRLKPHENDDKERRRRDLHGEYERIPSREPVDFIVIEDLSRYRSSQGRAPSENSRLMSWAHRAVRDKFKMLAEEPFGIPVVEVAPSYSSRFHAINGQPGARAQELGGLEPWHDLALEKLANRSESTERHRARAANELREQFRILAELNRERSPRGMRPHTLYLPKPGGPLFLAARDGNAVQADTNAAINLGFRAIAAPGCIDIHRRVRTRKEKGIYRARRDNAREKAAFSKADVIEIRGGVSRKLETSSSPNFFYEPDDLPQADGQPAFDVGAIQRHRLVSGVSLWSMVNNAVYQRCVEINRLRLDKWADDLP